MILEKLRYTVKSEKITESERVYEELKKIIAELEAKLAVYSHLAQAMDDVKLGRVQNADDAFDDIIAELENLDL